MNFNKMKFTVVNLAFKIISLNNSFHGKQFVPWIHSIASTKRYRSIRLKSSPCTIYTQLEPNNFSPGNPVSSPSLTTTPEPNVSNPPEKKHAPNPVHSRSKFPRKSREFMRGPDQREILWEERIPKVGEYLGGFCGETPRKKETWGRKLLTGNTKENGRRFIHRCVHLRYSFLEDALNYCPASGHPFKKPPRHLEIPTRTTRHVSASLHVERVNKIAVHHPLLQD